MKRTTITFSLVLYEFFCIKQDFSIIKKSLVERGQQFLRSASISRDKIARLGNPFITDGAVCYLDLCTKTQLSSVTVHCSTLSLLAVGIWFPVSLMLVIWQLGH